MLRQMWDKPRRKRITKENIRKTLVAAPIKYKLRKKQTKSVFITYNEQLEIVNKGDTD